MFDTLFTEEVKGVKPVDQNASFCCQQCDLSNDVLKNVSTSSFFETIREK